MAKLSKKEQASPRTIQPEPVEAREGFSAKPVPISWKALLQSATIIAAVFWIYGPVLNGNWLWDDDRYITNNPLLHSLVGLWKIWFEPGATLDYYPVDASVEWVQWHLWGMNTLGYHLTNVVLHIVSSLLVWRLLSKFGLELAWLGGMLFAIHPVQVESVAWMAELKNTLSLPPLLLAMIFYIDYDERKRGRDYWLALGLFLIAILCKLSVVFLPVVILLYSWWRRGRIDWADLKKSGLFFVLALVVGLVTMLAGIWDRLFDHLQPDYSPDGGILGRLVLAGLCFSFYFSKAFLPVGLMPVYPVWAVDYTSPLYYLPWLALGAGIYFLWRKRESWGRHVLLGLGFFLINLAPCPGFIPAPNMGYAWVMDHFLYLPIIGLIGLVIAGLGRLKERIPAPWIYGVLVVVMTLFTLGSRTYASLFINQETLWTYSLQRNPQAWPANINLGDVWVQGGHFPEAIEQYEQALKIKPDNPLAHNNLGNALTRAGRVAEAGEQFEQALEIKPDYAVARFNLGNVLRLTGHVPEATEQYEQALKIEPEYAEARNNLGICLAQTGRLPDAIEQFKQALKINPDFAEAHYDLGKALGQMGRVPEALEQYEQALKIDPDYAEARNNLGICLAQTGHLTDAVEQFKQALNINPDYAEAHNNLGIALAQTGHLPDAIEQFKQALKINPEYVEASNNLKKLQAAPTKK